ncbi:tRNA lysidine(34) synthetase TilS [Ruicaihuangia caeni]|uniref:tRNA lysidine(34) synthetase TilS n=1 Tax=Ruicaihuangia caeni TaxID=3042517 RepID=UPI00338EBF1E
MRSVPPEPAAEAAVGQASDPAARPAPRRPRLTPAIADVRRAVRGVLVRCLDAEARTPDDRQRTDAGNAAPPRDVTPAASAPHAPDGATADATRDQADGRLVLVALSGGPDSLALAAATAFEAPRHGLRAGAVIVDHGLQSGSALVAANAAATARALGLDPVVVRRVEVGEAGGPEAAARDARYSALAIVAQETGAVAVMTGHTLDDQAETVLLGLARGSGGLSLGGMRECVPLAAATYAGEQTGGPQLARPLLLRPLLGIRRSTTEQSCTDLGLTAWADPHNDDTSFTRVRVRTEALPALERALGAHVVEALARTADVLREDAEALDRFTDELIEELAELEEGGLSLPVAALAANPAALRNRLIRKVVDAEFHRSLSRAHTLEVARLVTDWRGQGALHLPGIRVERVGDRVVFTAAPLGHDADA